MSLRSIQLAVVALLLVSGLIAGWFLWTIEQRASDAMAAGVEASARLMRMADVVSGIGTAHQGYVAPGQLDEPWFERASTLTSELSRELADVRGSLRSPEAPGILTQLTASIDTLSETDARTRRNLRLGQDLMASDVIFSDGRNLLDTMTASLRNLHAAEQGHLRTILGEVTNQRRIAYALVAGVWLVGMLALVAASSRMPVVEAVGPPQVQPQVLPPPKPQKQSTDLDLAAASAVCTDLSRITSTAALPALLGRAAGVLDAAGLILWVGAGEQLFAVMGHGYDDEAFTRFGPIARDAENAAAAAWRTGRLVVVPATTSARGAVIAPLFGLHNCIGVLSVEMRHGENSATVQAVATMFAAQLSTVVPAWPAGSLSPGETAAAAAEARSA